LCLNWKVRVMSKFRGNYVIIDIWAPASVTTLASFVQNKDVPDLQLIHGYKGR
jgi:hypothetical protein